MVDCATCKENRQTIPYVAHEGAMARAERHSRRLVIALVIAILLIFASNAMWLYCWMQYDCSSEEYTVDLDTGEDGNANYIGQDGDIYNGESTSDQTAQD